MSNHYYKDNLYPLQDKVLKEIGFVDTPFYLTGGTLLGRFLLNHRYSDDLDFFINRSPDFHKEVTKIVDHLNLTVQEITMNNQQDSFARCYVIENEIKLKIEFVNDVKYRVGLPIINSYNMLFDTWENVLSNKITALSRNAAKDFVDVLFLSFSYNFNWESIINHAKQKDAWISEINVSQQLMDFNIEKLVEVKFPEEFNLIITWKYLKIKFQ